MNERFRALLDDAVSDLQPADPDVLPTIVARGRAARRRRQRTIVAGALATVLLAGTAVVAGAWAADRPGPIGTVAAQAPMPRVVGRTIVAGDFTMPIPDGWRVVVGSPKAPCGEQKKTVLIYGSERYFCQYAPIMVTGMPTVFVPALGAYAGKTMVPLPPSPYTLRGGAPAWLLEPTDSVSNDPKGKAVDYSYSNTLIVPWSRVKVTLGVPGPQQKQIIESISVAPPAAAGRLALRDNVSEANLVRLTGEGTEPDYGVVSEADRIGAILRLLRAQRGTVDERHACTSPGLPVARLTLRQVDVEPLRSLEATPSANGKPIRIPDTETTIIISFGDCREAVSSGGGRVRLSPDTVGKLMRLFGIVTR